MEEKTIIHINDIKLPGNDAWTLAFNNCSDLWQKSNDTSLSKQQKKDYFDQWFHARQCLELGIY